MSEEADSKAMVEAVVTSEAHAVRAEAPSTAPQLPRQQLQLQLPPDLNLQSKLACADGTECLEIKAGVRDGLL